MALPASLSRVSYVAYDSDFFDDMLDMFHDGGADNCGKADKYIYDGQNWDQIVEQSSDYYVPRADRELVEQAAQDIESWGVPKGIPYIDFGVGGVESFKQHVVPIMRGLASSEYYGVDICPEVLARIKALEPRLDRPVLIKTEVMDFFLPTKKVISKKPALGVMNGLTLTNLYGAPRDRNIDSRLVTALKYLAQLCGNGWLLLTIDTNQNSESLRKAYATPLNSKLYLSVFSRMAAELPVTDFDPSLFVYDPEFQPDIHLWAHMARATKSQTFAFGPYVLRVEEGQKIHLLNSYKFSREFFESSCRKANLEAVRSWSHETGMMLYLLKDKAAV